jgi:hypothetical protein
VLTSQCRRGPHRISAAAAPSPARWGTPASNPPASNPHPPPNPRRATASASSGRVGQRGGVEDGAAAGPVHRPAPNPTTTLKSGGVPCGVDTRRPHPHLLQCWGAPVGARRHHGQSRLAAAPHLPHLLQRCSSPWWKPDTICSLPGDFYSYYRACTHEWIEESDRCFQQIGSIDLRSSAPHHLSFIVCTHLLFYMFSIIQ